MRKLQKWVATCGSLLLISAIGCSDDSEGGDGDGDGGPTATGGFVTNTGGNVYGDGDVVDPCFGALVYCTNGCVDLTSDEENCGLCGERCDFGQTCDDSMCVDESDLHMGGGGGGGGAGGGN